MKTIEEIKIELTLKMLSGDILPKDIYPDFPVDDELRTFICSLDPFCAYNYASNVDKKPHNETRVASCRYPYSAYCYALYVDGGPRDDTREASCRAINLAYDYALCVDKCATSYTREICYRDRYLKQLYREKFGD
jgi:hypothetical protein